MAVCFPREYQVHGRMSASRLQHFLPGSTKPLYKMTSQQQLQKYKKIIQAYKNIRDDIPFEPMPNMVGAMLRGRIYENAALQYLQTHLPIQHFQYQPSYQLLRKKHSASPQKKRQEHQMNDAEHHELQHIQTLGHYKQIQEQQETIGRPIPSHNTYDHRMMHETCLGKHIPVLPDGICTFGGQNTVVEVKCPTKHYTPSQYRKYIPQMIMEMKTYGCGQCLYVEYVTNTYKEEQPMSSVRVRCFPYNQSIMDQIETCFRALEQFALKMESRGHPYESWQQKDNYEALQESLNHLATSLHILEHLCDTYVKRYDRAFVTPNEQAPPMHMSLSEHTHTNTVRKYRREMYNIKNQLENKPNDRVLIDKLDRKRKAFQKYKTRKRRRVSSNHSHTLGYELSHDLSELRF